MKYKVEWEGMEFGCERSFLVRCVRNFGCAKTDLSDMVYEVGEEITMHLSGDFEQLCESREADEFIEDMHYDGEGDWEVKLAGWVTLPDVWCVGHPVAQALEETIGAVLLAEFHTPAESKKQPIEAAA